VEEEEEAIEIEYTAAKDEIMKEAKEEELAIKENPD